MPQPINYLRNRPDPTANIGRNLAMGLQIGNMIRGNREVAEQRRVAEEALIQEKQSDEQFVIERDELMKTGAYDPVKFAELQAKFPKRSNLAKMSEFNDALKLRQDKGSTEFLSTAAMLTQNGNIEQAKNLILERGAAYDDPNTKMMYEQFAELIGGDRPLEQKLATIDSMGGALMGESYLDTRKKTSDIGKTEAEAKNLVSTAINRDASNLSNIANKKADTSVKKAQEDKYRKDIEVLNIKLKGMTEGKSGVIPIEKRPAAEDDIRKELTKRNATFDELTRAFTNLRTAEKTGPGDLAIIFNYMNMLDPGVAVMDGDVLNAQNATGKAGRIFNWWNEFSEGNRFPDNGSRDKFVSQAKVMWENSKKTHDKMKKEYKGIVKRRGLNPLNSGFSEEDLEKPKSKFGSTGGQKKNMTKEQSDSILNF